MTSYELNPALVITVGKRIGLHRDGCFALSHYD